MHCLTDNLVYMELHATDAQKQYIVTRSNAIPSETRGLSLYCSPRRGEGCVTRNSRYIISPKMNRINSWQEPGWSKVRWTALIVTLKLVLGWQSSGSRQAKRGRVAAQSDPLCPTFRGQLPFSPRNSAPYTSESMPMARRQAPLATEPAQHTLSSWVVPTVRPIFISQALKQVRYLVLVGPGKARMSTRPRVTICWRNWYASI